ncbi:2' O-ribose methyltransferase [Cytospora paraplurivora]|uniref:rRNA methyltransferase 2, mitochondrial n=1 Tax=Cytospora paraplurivora TaxID=2898453 RepID=A0AAN9YKU2_9PEZI
MQTILSAAPLRRQTLGERLIPRLLSQLKLAHTNTTSTPSSSISPQSSLSSPHQPTPSARRHASTNSTWAARQSRDPHARAAKVQGLRGRAAFKLKEIDARYKLFRNGQTVVDLGYAPGSWSQVTAERVGASDDGRGRRGVVVGIDLIPAQPPRGVTSIQGDFLSPRVQGLVKEVVGEQVRRRDGGGGGGEGTLLVADRPSYIDMEKQASQDIEAAEEEIDAGRIVDTTGFSSNTLSNPHRLMNTSGINFRDHAGSMDLCHAALTFASDTLKSGGHFVCKFYQGAEDKAFQKKLQRMFEKVHREKPESSRSDSKEAYFVALRRKGDVTLADIEGV